MQTQLSDRSLFESVSSGKFEMDCLIVSIWDYQKRSCIKRTLAKITINDNSAIVCKILQHSERFCEILQNSVIDVDIWEE